MNIPSPVMVVRHFPIGRKDNLEPTPGYADGFGFMAPGGTRVVSVAGGEGGVMIATAVGAPQGVDIWHPLVICRSNVPFQVSIGVRLGEHLGELLAQAGKQVMLFHVFAELQTGNFMNGVSTQVRPS